MRPGYGRKGVGTFRHAFALAVVEGGRIFQHFDIEAVVADCLQLRKPPARSHRARHCTQVTGARGGTATVACVWWASACAVQIRMMPRCRALDLPEMLAPSTRLPYAGGTAPEAHRRMIAQGRGVTPPAAGADPTWASRLASTTYAGQFQKYAAVGRPIGRLALVSGRAPAGRAGACAPGRDGRGAALVFGQGGDGAVDGA